MIPHDLFRPAHRERLEALLQTPLWQEFLAQAGNLSTWRASVRKPPSAPSQLAGAVEYLKEKQASRLRALLQGGVTEEEALLQALGDWETVLEDEEPFPILFLGLVLTLECSFDPRCLYCNQVWLPRRLTLEGWKALVAQAAEPVPPYIYLTGGEPLLLGEEIWGDEGLVAFAVQNRCAVNLNTNAELITPQVAFQLVKVGLAKVHISLDTPDPQVQGELFQKPERVEAVWRGLFNLQIARALLGTEHPQIHINCVLTRRNLFHFPALLRFLLEVRPVRPLNFQDFAVHLIPVGGQENAFLRPTAEEWKRFYTETWLEAEDIWREYQMEMGMPEGKRRSLAEQMPFANPFLRVEHRMSLEEYCQQAAQGIYWQGALTRRCYVAPSQAFVLPDGSQHWCGAHAIQRPAPLGNVQEAPLRENIRRNRSRWKELPNAFCRNCAGATCVINQSMERSLRAQIAAWKKEQAQS